MPCLPRSPQALGTLLTAIEAKQMWLSPLNVDTPHPAVPTRIPSALLWA